MTIHELLQQARQRLLKAPGLTPDDQHNADREAQILLAHALDCRRSYLLAYPELEPTDGKQRDFRVLVDKRCHGEPVAYLVGQREFYGLALEVDEAVLIPRPETELLVEQALSLLPENSRVADLGTGSGAIAVALAKLRRGSHIVATDACARALNLARKNAARHRLVNIEFHQGYWLDALPRSLEPLDMIVSNPPYVAAGDRHLSQGDCRFEPAMALTPGGDGICALQHIIAHAPAYLRPAGWLLLEHGYDQPDAVQALFAQGPWDNIQTIRDLAGQPRVSLACHAPGG